MDQAKKHILIISYYWPPSGGSGVQRWLKFVKFLSKLGWKITVYTPENPEFPVVDESLLRDVPEGVNVITQSIWEPYSVYKKFVGRSQKDGIGASFMSEEKGPSRAELMARWIRGNWFIPDARKFWIKPSIKFLSPLVSRGDFDMVISTGPPHSMHLIALALKEKFNIPWLADFRDPWTKIDFVDELRLTEKSSRTHAKLEKDVVQKCDHLIVVSNTMATSFSKLKNAQHISAIPNGYDADDFDSTLAVPLKQGFNIAHVGSLTPDRNAPALWKALAALSAESAAFAKELNIRFIGKIDFKARQELETLGLWTKVDVVDYVPHRELLNHLMENQVLLLLVNQTKNAKMILTGKIFEYLKANRPILALAPVDGDLSNLLKDTNAGWAVGFDDVEELKKHLLRMFGEHQSGELTINSIKVEDYSRENLALSLSELIKRILN